MYLILLLAVEYQRLQHWLPQAVCAHSRPWKTSVLACHPTAIYKQIHSWDKHTHFIFIYPLSTNLHCLRIKEKSMNWNKLVLLKIWETSYIMGQQCY